MNLTGQTINNTYKSLVLINGNNLTDGSGSALSSINITASYVINGGGASSLSSSYASSSLSSSYAGTASILLGGVQSASFALFALSASVGITNNIVTSASFASSSLSASYVKLASTQSLQVVATSAYPPAQSPQQPGQIFIGYNGSNMPNTYFSPSTTAGDWIHGWNFPSGISRVGSSIINNPYSNESMDDIAISIWNLNGSSIGSGRSGDSLFCIANWSTSSLNSGAGLGLAIHSGSGEIINNGTVSCAFNHVPQNRVKGLIPGNAMLVFNTDAIHMKGLTVCSPSISGIDSGNYSIQYNDFVNKLFRIPRWITASFQPTDLGWTDTLVANPMNGNVTISQSLYVGTYYITSSIGSLPLTTIAGINAGAMDSNTTMSVMAGPISANNFVAHGIANAATFNFGDSSGIGSDGGELKLYGPSNAHIATIGSTRLRMDASGMSLIWAADGTGDIGASGANRPNNGYFKGNIIASGFTGSLNGTSSYAGTASILLGSIVSASYCATASVLLGSIVSASNSFSSSYAGTASILLGSVVSSSFAITASYALNGGGSGGTTITTGSTYPITASWSTNAKTSSYAISSSNLSNGVGSDIYFLSNGEFVVNIGGNPIIFITSSISLLDTAGTELLLGGDGTATLTNESGSFIGISHGVVNLGDNIGSYVSLINNGQVLIGTPTTKTILLDESGSIQFTGSTIIPSLTGSLYGTSSIAKGIIPNAWNNLTFSATSSWVATPNVSEDKRILTLTGSSTLNITGLYNGWSGTLKTIQSGGSSNYNLYLPSGSKVINGGSGILTLTTGSNAVDFVGLEYDGTTLYAAIGNNFN